VASPGVVNQGVVVKPPTNRRARRLKPHPGLINRTRTPAVALNRTRPNRGQGLGLAQERAQALVVALAPSKVPGQVRAPEQPPSKGRGQAVQGR
jgi:hypothetical protein